MKDNFNKSLKLVLKHEGGYVDNPKDPGGATNRGITIAVLAAWRGKAVSKTDVRNLTLDEAGKIYKKQYWDAVKGDDLPEGLDYAMFDYAVNSGPTKAVRDLQKALGVKVDGHIGEITIQTINDYPNIKTLISKLCDNRLAWMKTLKTWKTFGKGWTSRVTEVKLNAIGMVGTTVAEVIDEEAATPVAAVSGSMKADVADVKPMTDSKNQAAAVTGLGGIGTVATSTAQQIQPLSEVVDVLKYVFVGLMLVGVGITVYLTFFKKGS